MRTLHTAFLVLFILSCLSTGYSDGAKSKFSSIISFGDSYTDTGNLVRWADPVLPPHPINNLPNGETFFGHPTGRASNGRIVLDFIGNLHRWFLN
jgi:phospholipase/lecithinase/hemolysin